MTDAAARNAQLLSIRLRRTAPSAIPPRHIALVGTFPPRQCGIASFTGDVAASLATHYPDTRIDIYALDDPILPQAYVPSVRTPVIHAIACDDPAAYARAARRINASGAEAVWIQHEFGIFGGIDGSLVCEFAAQIAAPLVVTFHTVLSAPSEGQRAVIEQLVRRASRIMVMSQHGRDLLVSTYRARPEDVEVIEHGAPDRPFGREAMFKTRLGLGSRPVLMTFGLIGPGKGIESVIAALPAIAAGHPDVLYRIVGATHPVLAAREGEAYRAQLVELARTLGVERNVEWIDRFLDTPELLDQLEACDIYVTPYPNLQQATSGTLSYAVALGKAVVSTPFVHASELLAGEVGLLVEPNSTEAISTAVNQLLDAPERLAAIKQRAYARGRRTIWPNFARAGAELLSRAAGAPLRGLPLEVRPALAAVLAMSDGTGMLQHSVGPVPDRRHGYCLDDNARALMLFNLAEGIAPAERMRWTQVYAAFIEHAWNADLGRFRNFMRFDRGWCEDEGSQDSNGRAVWALGHTVEHARDRAVRRWALGKFEQVLPFISALQAPRTMAFTALGALGVLRAGGDHAAAEAVVRQTCETMSLLLTRSRRPDWAWFEAMLGYDNPRLCQVLIEAGSLMGSEAWLDAGLETLAWICRRQTSAAGLFRPIGSETFGRVHSALPFDQQPLEGLAAVEAAAAAFDATADVSWLNHARSAYAWYHGANDRGVPLADCRTGRCRDGVTPRGANENCGAESILAFQLAYWRYSSLVSKHAGAAAGEGTRDATQEAASLLAHT